MAIDGISSATIAQVGGGAQSPAALTGFRDLTQALQSGDLADAQKAFGSLQQIQNSQLATSDGDDGAVRAAFQRLGTALRSGDVKGAQDALATLKQATRKVHGNGNRHHHREPAKPSATTPTRSATTTSPAKDSALGVLAHGVDAIA